MSRFFKRLIVGDSTAGGSAATLRKLIVWIFIAVVATFLTDPSDGPRARGSPSPVRWHHVSTPVNTSEPSGARRY